MSCAFPLQAMNHTAESNGLVPSLLLFGEMPQVPHTPNLCLFPATCRTAFLAARKEYELAVAKRRIQTALHSQPPASHIYRFVPEQPVKV